MATKRLTGDHENIEEAEVIDATAEDVSSVQEVIDDELAAMFAEFGGDDIDAEFRIFVKRVIPNKGKLEHCFSAVPSELPILDKIRDEFGPGEYQVAVYNKNRLRKRRSLNIATPLKKPVTELMRESKQDLAGLVATMAEQQRQTMQMVQESMRQPQQPAADPVAMMTAMMGAMVQMKEFLQPQQNNPMDMFVKGIEIAKDIAGGGAEKNIHDSMISIAREALPMLAQAAKTEQTIKAQQLPQNPQANPTQPPQQQLTQQPEQNSMTPEQERAFREFKLKVDFLVIKAAQQADPGFMADMVAELVSPEDIKTFIVRADALDYLAQFNPDVRAHAPWFESLQAELKQMFGMAPDSDANLTTENEDGKSPPITEEISIAPPQEPPLDETTGNSELTESP